MMHDSLMRSVNGPTPRQAGSATGSDEWRWARVVARDAQADGSFVYAVTSTRVFCRPSCPSRRPRRDRVRFFDTPLAAEAAGFRSCKRCGPGGAGAAPRSAFAVRRVAAYLRTHATEQVPLAVLARIGGLSPSYLHHEFRRALGVSPRDFQAAVRADRFRGELRAGRDVTSAIYEAGYGSPSRVYEAPPTGRGLSPAAYKRGGDGKVVGFAIVPCALGQVLVAATADGVCAVKIGASATSLETELCHELPTAKVVRDRIVRRKWIGAVVSRIDGRGAGRRRDLPLDIQGTAFQWQVWRALQRIPAGETRSYAAVARAIGRPTAARAVARACRTNPVAVVVPCHRVVGSDGAIGGYRWGVDRKRRLLDREANR